MRVKDSLSDLIGKIISGVVVAQYPDGNPRCRIYLTFTDGTAFEFWADDYGIEIAGGLEHGSVDQLVSRLRRRERADIVAFRPPHEDPNVPQRDLLTGGD